jgi:uncharacterized membrane-anchored protein
MRLLLTTLLCLTLTASPLAGAGTAAATPATPAASAASSDAATEPATITTEQFLAGLNFQHGKVSLPGGIATLNLPSNFRYLNPRDAEKVLVDGWGNPPGAATLGMILPTGVNPLSPAGWGVIVTYDKDGHVKDNDADTIDYADLLKDMQESIADNNPEREKAGYAPMTLVGWAEKPSYDKAQHKLYWAKELRTSGDKENGLNYNIRVLGREGVLVLNAIAGMAQIAGVKAEMKNVTAFTDFTPGNRYADFNSQTDKVAEYGLAALVAGGVAAKLGVFSKLMALLLAFKKIIVLAVAGGGAWLFKLLGRKKAAPGPLVDLSKPE